ncbi:rCG29808 [Rattus norvegicus]|uniref:RCG29808 n=1 Tax=Rattus norvegicus TaxID=10116 RepID=A6IN09_RAT|nr:rCG29808 [Rattus norvegicus]
MDALVEVDGVFSGHHLVDGRTALLLLDTLLCESHSAGLTLERQEEHFLKRTLNARFVSNHMDIGTWAKMLRPLINGEKEDKSKTDDWEDRL